MKRVGRYLWFAFVVAFAAYAVVTNCDALPDFFQRCWDYFLKLSLIIKITIAFVTWLILVIVPWFLYTYLSVKSKGCAEVSNYLTISH